MLYHKSHGHKHVYTSSSWGGRYQKREGDGCCRTYHKSDGLRYEQKSRGLFFVRVLFKFAGCSHDLLARVLVICAREYVCVLKSTRLCSHDLLPRVLRYMCERISVCIKKYALVLA